MTPEELEKLPKPLERTMTALEMDIMLEVVNRIWECSQITPVTDWLLNRMTAIGMSKKRIKEILREGVKTAGIDIDEIYETAARSDYVRNSEIYKAVGMDAIPYEDNDWLKQERIRQRIVLGLWKISQRQPVLMCQWETGKKCLLLCLSIWNAA